MAAVSAGSLQRMGTWNYLAPHDPIYGNVILLYHCEDNAASTTFTDSSTNGYNGTASANTNTAYSATGKFNGGINCNSSVYVTNNTAGLLTAVTNALNGYCTVEWWAKLPIADWSTGGADWTMCMVYGDANNFINVEYSFGTNTFWMQWRGNSSTKQVSGAPTWEDDNWHHYKIVVDQTADNVKFYVDGAQWGSTQSPAGSCATAITNVYLGCTNTTAKKFPGIIDELTISSVVR